MDDAADTDKFSVLDDELISNITRPSLVSFSSEDSLSQENVTLNALFADRSMSMLKTSSPLRTNIVEHSSSHESGGNEDYEFKMPANFSTAKRYSLTILNDMQNAYNVSKSSSMLDVSSLMSFSPLHREAYMYSNETLQSNSIATTKSKDSGFQRSTSCTSLTTSSSKKYDHVQSKVKQYIQTIKQTEAVRKIQKRMENKIYRKPIESSSFESPDSSPVSNTSTDISKKDLLNKVKELEEELKERDCVIEQLEKNQSELRLKYAAAENRIDDLRIRASQNEEPMKSYITDDRVAELLTSSAKNSRRYSESGIAKHLKSVRREGAILYDLPQFVQPVTGSRDRELQPIRKLCSSPVIKTEGISKSLSCKYVVEPTYQFSKSASNLNRPSMVQFMENDPMDIPYEKNSFAKVQQWQRSLVNLDKANDECHNPCCMATDDTFYMFDDSLDETRLKKSRRYQKNKDADKKRYRQSYPVGCKCEKFKKCKSKEDLNTSAPSQLTTGHRKFRRTVSFASYEDSLTSSMYDDGESSSEESVEMLTPSRHESYKNYRQRKLQERQVKEGREFEGPTCNKIKKARSAGNIYRGDGSSMVQNRHKRIMDGVATGCEPSCSDRRHCSKLHSKKYRKLDDCSKVASFDCHGPVKYKNVGPTHACRSSAGYQLNDDMKAAVCLTHSKSFDDYGRRCDARDRGHRMDKLECSCLLALENLKLQEHHVLAKLTEQVRVYPRKAKEKETTLLGTYKLCSLQK